MEGDMTFGEKIRNLRQWSYVKIMFKIKWEIFHFNPLSAVYNH